MLAPPIVPGAPERRVAEAHQRVGGDLVHPQREALGQVAQERSRLRVVELDVDDQVDVDQLEAPDRVARGRTGRLTVVGASQVSQHLVGE